MSKDVIRYDLLAQEALRNVVRKVLSDAVRIGLPGEHHFYIAFDTTYPGVRLSQRLREQYPKEMTVVLQHQFWDLAVTEHAFEVGLSFGNVPERLLIPFDSVKGFFDPSVQFGLQFEVMEAEEEDSEELEEDFSDPDEKPQSKAKKDSKKKTLPKGAGSEPQSLPGNDVPQIKPKKNTGKKSEPPLEGGAEVVSLDKFRKPKN